VRESRYQSAADLLDSWRDELLSGDSPVLYPAGSGEFSRIEIGPGIVTLLGGAPGGGKTALVMQLIVEALFLTPTLKCLVCNVEMSPGVLLDRQLARLAAVDLSLIRHRKLEAGLAGRIERGLERLEQVSGRLAFVRAPFDLENVAASADSFGADLILLDYIQRISAPGEHGDRRGSVDATMSYLRQFADAGTAVIVVAAVSRSKDTRGRSTYGEGLGLASFRETSELEYGADDAFILTPDNDGEAADVPTRRVVLRHLKSRHGETRDMTLTFHLPYQRFTACDAEPPTERGEKVKLQAALKAMWATTHPASETDEVSW
jgi:replicative DNA helicase